MWTFITQLLVTLVLLGFFLVSCQNVMHIVKGSLCFVLKHIHQELDKELGESEGVSDDEETISTRVVRRRVFLKVTTRQEAGLRARHCHVRGQQLGGRCGTPRQGLGAAAGAGLGVDSAQPTAPRLHRRLSSGTWEATLPASVSVEGLSTPESAVEIEIRCLASCLRASSVKLM